MLFKLKRVSLSESVEYQSGYRRGGVQGLVATWRCPGRKVSVAEQERYSLSTETGQVKHEPRA